MSNWNLVIPMRGKSLMSGDFNAISGITGASNTNYGWNVTPIDYKYRGNDSQFRKHTLGNSHDAILVSEASAGAVTHENLALLDVDNKLGTAGVFVWSCWIYIPSSNDPNDFESAGDLFWTANGTDLSGTQIAEKLPDFSLLDQWQQIYVVHSCELPAPTAPYTVTDFIDIKLESSTYSGASWEYYSNGRQFELITDAYNMYGYTRPTTFMFSNILGCRTEVGGTVFIRDESWGGLVFNFEDELHLPISKYQGTSLSKREIDEYTSLKAGKNVNLDENSWAMRTIIFNSTLIGQSADDLSNKKRELQSLFSNTNAQILYTGDGKDKIAKVVYASGLEGNSPNGFVEEAITINFNMYDPFFYGLQKVELENNGGFELYDTNRLDNYIAIFDQYGEKQLPENGTGGGYDEITNIVVNDGIIYFTGTESGGIATGLGKIQDGQYTYDNADFTGDTILVQVDAGAVVVIGKANPADTKYQIGFNLLDGSAFWQLEEMGNPSHPSGTTNQTPTKLTILRDGLTVWACVYFPTETSRFLNVLVVKATYDYDLVSWTIEQFPMASTASSPGSSTNGWSATKYIHDAILLPQIDEFLEKPLVAIGGQFTFTTYGSPALTFQNNIVLEPDELDGFSHAAHSFQYLYDSWYYSQDTPFYRISQICFDGNKTLLFAEFNNNDTTFGSTNWKTRLASKPYGQPAEFVIDNLVYNSASSTTKPITGLIVDQKNRPIMYGNFVFDYVDWTVNQQAYQTRYRRVLYNGNVTYTNKAMMVVDGKAVIHFIPNVQLNRICYGEANELILAPTVTTDIISRDLVTYEGDGDLYKLEFDVTSSEVHYFHDVMRDVYYIVNVRMTASDTWQYRQENGQPEVKSTQFGEINLATEDIIFYPNQKNVIRINPVVYFGVYPYSGSDDPYGSITTRLVIMYAGVGY